MSMRLKLKLLISFLFITAIGNSLFFFQLTSFEEGKLFWVNHTHNVLHHSDRFLSSLKDTETGQRGYLLTNDASYLQPYYAGITDSITHFKKLKLLTKDNPQQQERLDLIHKMAESKFSELRQTIEFVKVNNNIEALALVKANKGKQYMDSLRRLLTNFNNEERLLLEQRKGDYKASRAKIETLILVQLLFFCFLAVFVLLFLNKNLFQPLKILLDSTKKTEEGKALSIVDVVPNDEMGYLLSSFYTMSEKVYERTKVLGHKAFHDDLTGLKNRSKMNEEIEHAINHSKESNTKLAIFFIDLNDFKVLNDTFGHESGDMILKEVAVRLKAALRSDDSIFRVGGDEFVVLIKDVKAITEIQYIVAKVLKTTESPVMIQGQQMKISLSLGVAVSPDDSINSFDIVKFADIAMYEAKRNKDTHFKFYDSSMLKRLSDPKQ
ncbi:CHASE3 domain-containing protein [Colwellia piezophila]|uniref:CHASE3 domain-containing protein n=1 Tax=Colwellia piezophila TaxID=211668 RepID=UPI00037A1563|nr:CHASE3 domain-containing protein [Colwellia piezophila]